MLFVDQLHFVGAQICMNTESQIIKAQNNAAFSPNFDYFSGYAA